MLKKLLIVALLLSSSCLTAFGVERDILQSPILFVKRYNYQGLHIYDTFYQWRPGGGIYILENPADPPEQHRIRPVIDPTTPETLGPGIYFDPSLSYDAQKILFCFKGSPQGNSVIYEIGLDGKGLRQITNLDGNGNPYKGTGGGHHDVKPCYLPDDRIVFCSTRYSGLVPCANNGVTILHVMNNDGSEIHTISVNNVTEFDPNPLPDGRVLFGRWEYIDKNALTIQSLWTVLPDGTNETALYANNMVFPEAVLQAKPVPGADHLIVATFAPHNSPPRGTIAMIDTRLGKNEAAAAFNFEHHDRPTFDRGDSCDPTAINENVVLYSGVPNEPDAPTIGNDTPGGNRGNPKLNALMLIDRTGAKTVVLSDPTIDLHNPIPIIPRERQRQITDTTDRTKITGNFFVHDVYEGNTGVARGTIKWLRVTEETSRVSESPGSNNMNQVFSISAALAWSPKIYHGIVPVEEDGSVYFEAPSGRSLNFQLLDADYRLVRSMRTFIQAAPGTTRSCMGCHEYKYGTTPSVSESRLLGRDPVKLRDESWGGGYLDYTKKVQPILDKHCVSCHGGEAGIAKGLDLSGGWTDYFNISYENLTARREKQYIADLIQGICCMNGTAYWSCKIFDPYEHGSGNAPLADILLSEPHKSTTGLSDADRELLFAWIDSNGLFFGTWDFTRAGPLAKEHRATKEALKAVMKKSDCARCHTDENGNVRRFDDWINLETPELSRILRAPLPNAGDKGTSENGYGLGLCRDRKVDQKFSRLGLMFQSGYEHGVKNLDQFPTQVWENWDEQQQGEPVISFASTNDATYQKMLGIIREARIRQLADPRVDMPTADKVGEGIIAGRFRQIIPQPLPEETPPLFAEVDDEGYVRFHWECSWRTVGLVFEIHRSTSPNFTPTAETRIDRTERFEFTDRTAPPGKVYYALIPVTDPAETCGTCKSGAVLDYRDSLSSFILEGGGVNIPMQKSIENRCPLSMVEPMKGQPSRTEAVVPQPKKPAPPKNLRVTAEPGKLTFQWDVDRPGQYRYKIGDAEPISKNRTEIVEDSNREITLTVRTVGRLDTESDPVSLTAKSLPIDRTPVFSLADMFKEGKLQGDAVFEDGVLDLSRGGHLEFPQEEKRNIRGQFSIELEVKFDSVNDSPLMVSNGVWRQSGWFVQKFGNGIRFHFSGVDCDGGVAEIGKWTKLLGTYDGQTVRLYQDGKLVGEKPAGNLVPWGGPMILGQYTGGIAPGFQMKGQIKNVRIYRCVM
ncbi:MAG: hypothetical protein FWC43_10385 [Planctomycetaceae bacterium]|nr:hypothetical protein [Planctomycetaceae bacterium]